MDEIAEIDDQFSPLHTRIIAAAEQMNFAYVCDLPNADRVSRQIYQGIYLIEIHVEDIGVRFCDWVENFRNEWDHPSFQGKFTCTTKDKRIAKHGSLREWMPLYIGKSKRVWKRVSEHWSLPLDAKTFALKISERKNMQNRRFRLSTLPLRVKNYDIIAPVFERTLRDRINPLVGKQ